MAEVMNWVLCTYGKVNFDNAGIAAIADLLSEQFPKIPKRRGKSFSWYNKLYNAASNRRNHSVSSSVPSSPPPSVRESPHRNHSPAAPMGVQEAYKDAIHAVNTVDLTPSAKVSHASSCRASAPLLTPPPPPPLLSGANVATPISLPSCTSRQLVPSASRATQP